MVLNVKYPRPGLLPSRCWDSPKDREAGPFPRKWAVIQRLVFLSSQSLFQVKKTELRGWFHTAGARKVLCYHSPGNAWVTGFASPGSGRVLSDSIPGSSDVPNTQQCQTPSIGDAGGSLITLWQGGVCAHLWSGRWCDWPPLPQAVKSLVTQQECQIILSPSHPPPPPPPSPVNCHSSCTRACWRVSFCRVATKSPHLWGAFWSQACDQYVRCSISCLAALPWWRWLIQKG